MNFSPDPQNPLGPVQMGVSRGFRIGDVDINCGLQLQLFLMLTANYFQIWPVQRVLQ